LADRFEYAIKYSILDYMQKSAYNFVCTFIANLVHSTHILFDREVSESETACVKPVMLPVPRRFILARVPPKRHTPA
jgi:bacteriorhodopsin